MQYRRFGRLGWEVSEVGYGMWGMAGWKGSEEEESLESLQRAVDLGCTFFDTAYAYGAGMSEGYLGRLVKSNPENRLYTATKIPPKNWKWPSKRAYTAEDCFPPDHVREYVEKSLSNLQLPSLDLIQFHTWEDGWLEDERWYKELDRIRGEGLIGGIGISINRWEPFNGIKAVNSGLIDAVQVIYNIFDQNPEDELFPACREKEVAVIARVPFDEGTLTGNLSLDTTWPEGDWRATYFVPENLKSSVEHGERLKPVVPEGMSMPEMALRFILQEPTVSTVIPGMRKMRHVEANIAASDGEPLGDELMSELRRHRWDRQPTEWSQ